MVSLNKAIIDMCMCIVTLNAINTHGYSIGLHKAGPDTTLEDDQASGALKHKHFAVAKYDFSKSRPRRDTYRNQYHQSVKDLAFAICSNFKREQQFYWAIRKKLCGFKSRFVGDLVRSWCNGNDDDREEMFKYVLEIVDLDGDLRIDPHEVRFYYEDQS